MELLLVIIVAYNVKIVVKLPVTVQLVKGIGELELDLYQLHFVLVRMENLMMELVFYVKVKFLL